MEMHFFSLMLVPVEKRAIPLLSSDRLVGNKEVLLSDEAARWKAIAEDARSMNIVQVAQKHGVNPGDIAVKLLELGVDRQVVRPPEAAEVASAKAPKSSTSSTSSDNDRVVVNGIACRPNTRDVAIAEKIDQLGKISDPDFGKLVQASPRVVGQFRRRHGIEPFQPDDTAPKASKAPAKGGKRSKIDAYYDLLGTVPDSHVAEKAGVTANAVSNYRRRRGIAGYDPSQDPAATDAATKSSTATTKGGRRSKISPFHDQVGTVPDRVIAEKAGVTVNAVSNYRRRRKIPAFEGAYDGPSATSAPSASVTTAPSAPTPRTSSGERVYVVTRDDSSTAYVVASSLAEAAQRVDKHRSVIGIAYLGDVLA